MMDANNISSQFRFLLDDNNQRFETVIVKLTNISSELKNLIAIHEQRNIKRK